MGSTLQPPPAAVEQPGPGAHETNRISDASSASTGDQMTHISEEG